MKKLMWFIGAVCFALGLSAAPKGINVLLVTGGHKYDEKEFLDMFSRMENVTFTHMTQPEVQETLTYEKTEPWDVIVFYDLWQQATDKSKQDLAEMIRRGRSVLFFHHSICSYDNWPEWLNITGGKFIMKSYVDPSGLITPVRPIGTTPRSASRYCPRTGS